MIRWRRIWAPACCPLTPEHVLGTDDFGRDILSRILYGSRTTLYIVVLVIVTAPVFGLIIGTDAGYFGGWTDQILMRVTDIFLAFPRLILTPSCARAWKSPCWPSRLPRGHPTPVSRAPKP